MDQNASEDIGAKRTATSVGLNPILDPLQCLSRWLLELERQQENIIELWFACNVFLVHRT
ncbi:putative Kinesin-like protein KIN-7F [Cocos nucifera]|uniref:Putative Kinesin-like protein KIN-7F n=1 Tax=Cocos nucifera TaxID=13894 RepID=A0A8K0ITC0_COCNU|nr:putative Kinesin-like protein KIN-7F [Cocos nucifera]